VTRLVVPVALLLVLAGCSGFAGPDGERAATETLTPAPVPEPDPVRTPGGATTCLAPRAVATTGTPPPTPATPAPLPVENGTVRGDQLVERHLATLVDHSFSLRAGETSVTSMAGGVAFSFEGTLLGFGPVRMYAVGGTLYRLKETDRGVTVTTTAYDGDSERRTWYFDVLSGEVWLSERVGRSTYRAAGTRTWNGTAVRVFESTRAVTLTDAGRTVPANSTVLVDRRGLIRRVRHVSAVATAQSATREVRVETYAVDDVGTATLSRPDAFCVPAAEAVTPTP
jgi:hypothetical protein